MRLSRSRFFAFNTTGSGVASVSEKMPRRALLVLAAAALLVPGAFLLRRGAGLARLRTPRARRFGPAGNHSAGCTLAIAVDPERRLQLTATGAHCLRHTAVAGDAFAVVTAWNFSAGPKCPECLLNVAAYCRRQRAALYVSDSGGPAVQAELAGRSGYHVKQLAATLALGTHEFVAWLDADAFVAAPDTSILDFFRDRRTDIVMQDDVWINTGVFLLRAGRWTDFVLRHAWAAAPAFEAHPADQVAFQHALHTAFEAVSGGAYAYRGACAVFPWLAGNSCWRFAHLTHDLRREPCRFAGATTVEQLCVGAASGGALRPAPFLRLVSPAAPLRLQCTDPNAAYVHGLCAGAPAFVVHPGSTHLATDLCVFQVRWPHLLPALARPTCRERV
jgi:hypothetical protein